MAVAAAAASGQLCRDYIIFGFLLIVYL